MYLGERSRPPCAPRCTSTALILGLMAGLVLLALLAHTAQAEDWTNKWHFEPVKVFDGQSPPSAMVGVGDDRSVHVVYCDADSGLIRHAMRTPEGRWTWDDVHGLCAFDGRFAMTMAEGSHPVIVFQSSQGMGLLCAEMVPDQGWFVQDIWSDPWNASLASVVAGRNGTLHVCFADLGASTLMYAWRTSEGEWLTQAVYTMEGIEPVSTSVCLDGKGQAHLFTMVHDAGGFEWVEDHWKDGGNWSNATVPGTLGTEPPLLCSNDSQGRLHLLMATSGSGSLVHSLRNTDGDWSQEVVTQGNGPFTYASMCIGSDDSFHVCYYNMSTISLVYATKDAGGGSWRASTVASPVVPTAPTSICLENATFAHVVYLNALNGTMCYARWIEPPDAPLRVYAEGYDGYNTVYWSDTGWEGNSPVKGFILYGGDGISGEVLLDEQPRVASRLPLDLLRYYYYHYNLTNWQEKSYYVVTVNEAGTSDHSVVVNATPWRGPGPPRNLTVVPGLHNVSVSWDPPEYDGGSPIIGYRASIDNVIGDWDSRYRIEVTFGDVRHYVFEGLADGITHHAHLAAVNKGGHGELAHSGNVTPVALPLAPSGLTAKAGNASVMLAWRVESSKSSGTVRSFSIYRGADEGNMTLLRETSYANGSTQSYVDSEVRNGRTYLYWVTAIGIAGEGPVSNVVIARPANVPGPPQNLTAIAGDGQVVLTWSPPVDDGGLKITRYIVYRADGGKGMVSVYEVRNGTTISDVRVTNGVRYAYHIVAYNELGHGDQSGDASATPSPPKPALVSGLREGLTIVFILVLLVCAIALALSRRRRDR